MVMRYYSPVSAALVFILNRQRRLVERFQDVGAVSPDAAKRLAEIGVTPSFMFSRMSARGVFVSESSERWWLDAAAWTRYRQWQTKRMVVGGLAVLAACVLVVALLMSR